jgi:hypothetical protein
VREINCEVLRLAQSGKKLNEMLKLNGDANVCGYGRMVHMVHMVHMVFVGSTLQSLSRRNKKHENKAVLHLSLSCGTHVRGEYSGDFSSA